MARVKVKDIEIAYSIHGSGDPLFLIGGYTMVKESWKFQVAELEKYFRIITF